MESPRAALAITTIAIVVTGCATTAVPSAWEPPPRISTPLTSRSLPAAHTVAMVGIGAVAGMSAQAAGAALRPASAEHVLWNRLIAGARGLPRRAEPRDSGMSVPSTSGTEN